MLQYLSNAFKDPSDPWYYVIGLLFLLAIFGALAAYVILSAKKKPGEQNNDEQSENTDIVPTDADHAGESEGTDTVSNPQEPNDK